MYIHLTPHYNIVVPTQLKTSGIQLDLETNLQQDIRRIFPNNNTSFLETHNKLENQHSKEFTAFMKETILDWSLRMPSDAQMPLLTSTPSGLRVDRASKTFSGLIPPAKSQPYLLLIFGSFNRAHSNAFPLQKCLISSKRLSWTVKGRLSNKLMDVKLYKKYAFTCHLVHYQQGPNQLENTLPQK